MAEMQLNFSGRNAIIGVGILALVLVYKLITLGPSSDPKLEQTVRDELSHRLGGAMTQALQSVDSDDAETKAFVASKFSPENIEIHAISISKPIMSLSSNAKSIVRVEFSLPNANKRQEYWRFDHSLLAGWRYRGRSSAASYYLNFI